MIFNHTILSRARLPIPPLRLKLLTLSYFTQFLPKSKRNKKRGNKLLPLSGTKDKPLWIRVQKTDDQPVAGFKSFFFQGGQKSVEILVDTDNFEVKNCRPLVRVLVS